MVWRRRNQSVIKSNDSTDTQADIQAQNMAVPDQIVEQPLNYRLLHSAQLLPERQAAWNELCTKWQQCTRCPLNLTRNKIVLGSGSLLARVMLVGEAPGENEDKQGEPFVGRAGKLLQALLRSINLDREQIFITNILKCRPPRNRDPLASEVELCTPLLKAQIQIIKPSLLVAVGRIAAQFLLNSNASMKQLRERWLLHPETQTPLLVTYHPAYLLRSPQEKAKAYQDFLMIKHRLLKE